MVDCVKSKRASDSVPLDFRLVGWVFAIIGGMGLSGLPYIVWQGDTSFSSLSWVYEWLVRLGWERQVALAFDYGVHSSIMLTIGALFIVGIRAGWWLALVDVIIRGGIVVIIDNVLHGEIADAVPSVCVSLLIAAWLLWRRKVFWRGGGPKDTMKAGSPGERSDAGS